MGTCYNRQTTGIGDKLVQKRVTAPASDQMQAGKSAAQCRCQPLQVASVAQCKPFEDRANQPSVVRRLGLAACPDCLPNSGRHISRCKEPGRISSDDAGKGIGSAGKVYEISKGVITPTGLPTAAALFH